MRRLSEDILVGSKGMRQIKNHLWDMTDGVCAMGAALRGAGLYKNTGTRLWAEIWPGIYNPKRCPVCSTPYLDIVRVVVCLNNTHSWSFWQIASWVRECEDELGVSNPTLVEEVEAELVGVGREERVG